ncbi:uncharacterized protein LOC111013415 [Momordica charantia]|uniref:Uncharacterized protein LOC111013415 n=1 Tax=Momordica charantia TaxID=3673 RepID=A0A6J1CP55_MOMCH|nr:uncharacterized protein LOC111013415 [Momordica charantia]
MDREQEDLQFLSFFGIFRESFNIVFQWRKIFSKITLTLILPLSVIFLAHIQVSELLFFKILNNEDSLSSTPKDSPNYSKLSDVISSEWIGFWLFKAAYFTFFLVLALLSTAAVVYTVACIYTAKEVTFRKVISVVPKVWRRLMLTFVWNSVIVLVYNIAFGVLLFLWAAILGFGGVGIVILGGLAASYLVGFVYISVVWHLASVVSVLEDVYGIQAMVKSRELIKGKMKLSCAVFLTFALLFLGSQLVFQTLVVLGSSKYNGLRIALGILCFLLLFKVFLFGLVAQTIIYFVCKSYHHQNIDKSSLSDHLEVYLGEYVPLKAQDVQLGDLHV